MVSRTNPSDIGNRFLSHLPLNLYYPHRLSEEQRRVIALHPNVCLGSLALSLFPQSTRHFKKLKTDSLLEEVGESLPNLILFHR